MPEAVEGDLEKALRALAMMGFSSEMRIEDAMAIVRAALSRAEAERDEAREELRLVNETYDRRVRPQIDRLHAMDLGVAVGDSVLKAAVDRLESCLSRPSDKEAKP